jgi:hypothetical protein
MSCSTKWCDAHIRLFGEGRYCRRHASTVAALKSFTAPTEQLPPLPPLGNRWASLLRWMTKELDGPIRELLEKRGFGDDDTLIASGRIDAADASRGTWTWRWSAVDGGEVPRLTVTLSGSEESEDQVEVSVNDRTVNRETPPWVAHRKAGRVVDASTDARERLDYLNRIMAGIASALRSE